MEKIIGKLVEFTLEKIKINPIIFSKEKK